MIRDFISKLYGLYTPSFFISGGGSSNYVIERSLRLSSASSQYLSRTFSSAGNQKKWTWSGWVKRGTLGVRQFITMSGANPNPTQVWQVEFNVNNKLEFYNQTINTFRLSTALYRDVGAWYHIVFCADTDNATAQLRFRCWVNGVEVTAWDINSTISSGYSFAFNGAYLHGIGAYTYSPSSYLDGYLSEVQFINDQALGASSFGETNSITGQWIAKKYTGVYGTNGFYLDFKDGTSTTTLGYDKSGNNNHWALTNFTRSAGVNDCWMLDVPAGNGSGSAVQPSSNYAVLNTLDISTFANPAISNASLGISNAATGNKLAKASIKVMSGKVYFETVIGSVPTANGLAINLYYGATFCQYAFNSGVISVNGSSIGTFSTATNGDVIGVAIDRDNNTVAFYKNNTLLATGTGVSSGEILIAFFTGSASVTDILNVNFGQRSFAYTPPSGFKALCTANLTSTDVIESGSFTGNANAVGPFIWCNGTPETLTINGNAVTWGTHADRLSNGFKLRTASSSYNSSGTNTWTATILSPESKSAFKHQNAKGN